MARSHWPECHSVCFSNRNLGVRGANGSYSVCSRSILAVRLRTDAYGTAFGSSKNVLCMFIIIFIDHPNVASMCIREVFVSILGAYGMYGKRSGSMRLVLGACWNENVILRCWVPYAFPNTPNGPRTRRMLSERFQYPFRVSQNVRTACGKSLVQFRSIRHVLKAFGKHSERKPFEVNMRKVFGLF